MKIKIEPFDTLIFRDGKPFGSVEDTWTNSKIFPSPATIYGALRAAYFAHHPSELYLVNTNEDPTKDLEITSIYYYHSKEKTALFPLPYDLVKRKKSSNNELFFLELIENSTTSSPLPYIFTSKDEVENATGFLSEIATEDYLESNEQTFHYYEFEYLLHKEPKIGIGLDKKRGSVAEGKLYRIDFHRYTTLEIVVEFEGLKLPDNGVLKFGGEAKAARYELWEEPIVSLKSLEGTRLKIYCLTPAIFKQGWLPDFIDPATLKGSFHGIDLKLLAAAVGRTEYIGGWDIKLNRPKPMFKAIPAGSVYYFEAANEKDAQKAAELFDQNSISTYYPKEGFGRVFAGRVK